MKTAIQKRAVRRICFLPGCRRTRPEGKQFCTKHKHARRKL